MVGGGPLPNATANCQGLIVCCGRTSGCRQPRSARQAALRPVRPFARLHVHSKGHLRQWQSHGCRPSSDLLAGQRAFYGTDSRQLLQSIPGRLQSRRRLQPGAAGITHPTTAAAAIFGSVARSLLRSSPRQLFRALARVLIRVARPLLTGPGSVFVVLFTLVAGVVAAIRARMWNTCRSCKACHGFGIERCSLCRGAGVVGWEGKWSHKELCPSCLGKRFVNCPHCGGHFHRPTFVHARCRGRADALASMDEEGGSSDAFLARMVTD